MKSLIYYAGFVFVAIIYLVNAGDFLFFDSKPALDNRYFAKLHAHPEIPSNWFAAIFSSDSGITRRPLSMLTFALQVGLDTSVSPSAFRTINILLHFMNAYFLYLLAVIIARELCYDWSEEKLKRFGLLVSFIWLAHPLHVSTVLYSVQRMAQLSTLFIIIGAYAYSRTRLRYWHENFSFLIAIRLVFLVVFWSILAVFSKENGAILPAVIVLIEATVFKYRFKNIPSKYFKYSVFSTLAVGLSLFLFFMLHDGYLLKGYAYREFSFLDRLRSETFILLTYLKWFFLPVTSEMTFFHDNIAAIVRFSDLRFVLSASIWVVLIGVALCVKKNHPIFIFGLLFYFITHFFESTIFPLELVFEHRNYLPYMACSIVAAYTIHLTIAKTKMLLVKRSVVVFMILLCVLLYSRAHHWKDEKNLSTFNVLNNPKSFRTNYHFANFNLRRAGFLGNESDILTSISLARQYYQNCLDIKPDNLVALISLLYIDIKYLSAKDADLWIAKMRNIDKSAYTASEINSLRLLISVIGMEAGEKYSADLKYILEILANKFYIAEAFYVQAMIYWKSEDRLDEAEKLMRDAMGINSNNPLYGFAMLQILAEQEKFDEQIEILHLIESHNVFGRDARTISRLLENGTIALHGKLF